MGVAVKVKKLPADKADEAYDAGGAYRVDHMGAPGQPRERVQRDDNGMFIMDEKRGTPRRERVRRARAGLRYVTPAGVVIHSPMTAGSGQPMGSDPARESRVKAILFRAGSIRYGTCPLRDTMSLQWLTPEQRKWKPCEPGTYGENKACDHIEKIIKLRKEKHAKLEAKANEKYRSVQERQLEQDQQSNKNTADMNQNVAKLVEAMAARETLKPDG